MRNLEVHELSTNLAMKNNINLKGGTEVLTVKNIIINKLRSLRESSKTSI
jgi:hypothetical protein